MQLFAFYVGGKTATSNIELHDMRFAIGRQVEDCHESLRQQWWGTPESLHIDCWIRLTNADGHSIHLRAEKFPGPQRLFFVNLGGYDPAQFTELHSNIFVVANDKAAAKTRALVTVKQWKQPHRDTLLEVENILGLSDIASPLGLHIHLAPSPESPPDPFTIGYFPIGKI
jgi:hypothetical protein